MRPELQITYATALFACGSMVLPSCKSIIFFGLPGRIVIDQRLRKPCLRTPYCTTITPTLNLYLQWCLGSLAIEAGGTLCLRRIRPPFVYHAPWLWLGVASLPNQQPALRG